MQKNERCRLGVTAFQDGTALRPIGKRHEKGVCVAVLSPGNLRNPTYSSGWTCTSFICIKTCMTGSFMQVEIGRPTVAYPKPV
ncbi:MAG: hypothetical protein C0507_10490 [Cyanobacteria bacterium PR.3.49]|nr:hypothetical protein [Cyanobacteria bacterium PR.3.49]